MSWKNLICLASLCIALTAFAESAFAQPTVTLTTGDGSAAEAGLDPGTVIIERIGDTTSSLFVFVALTGNATIGADYSVVGWQFVQQPNVYRVTIQAGDSMTTLTLTPAADNLIEDGGETADFELVEDDGYVHGGSTQAQILISDDVATVTLTLADGDAAEAGQDPGSFTVTRTSHGRFDVSLFVLVELTGNATIGADYSVVGWQFVQQPNVYRVTIPGNQDSTTVTITPNTDNLIEDGGEDLSVRLISDATSYFVGADTDATIHIDDDVATVTLTLADGDAAEAGQDPGSFTVTRTSHGRFDVSLFVLVELTGNATIGADYSVVGWQFVQQPNVYRVTIPGNQDSTTVTITPNLDADEEEGDETIELLLIGDATTYFVGIDTTAIITIADFVNLVFKDSFETP